ncbi:MAG: PVC-type heme-binding CxxCH protein [Planctomycetota bacterium]
MNTRALALRGLAVLFVLNGFSIATSESPTAVRIAWRTKQLSSQFFSEGSTVGDFNRDGHTDIASGPFWYEGPTWETKHPFYPQDAFDPHGYSNNFFGFTEDFNGDGWDDILIYGFPGKDASWYENPRGTERFWPRHQVLDKVDNESPTFVDVNGDGRRDVVCSVDGYFGFAEVNREDPALPWKFRRISDRSAGGKFTHGLGVGDVNGDGRVDLLEKKGWWEQPEDPSEQWKLHSVALGEGHGPAQMFVDDVDDDGDNDIVCSLSAHGYGLAWFENQGDETFQRRMIMGSKPGDNPFGVVFSQLHAVELVDLDGDGLKDIVTGKRYWAHGPKGDPEPQNPPVIYWFQRQRTADGVEWIPRLIDDDSGVGVEVDVADVNGDDFPDVIIANKKGTYVHLQSRSAVTPQQAKRDVPLRKDQRAEPRKKGTPDSAGLQPMEAAAAMTVPDGFQVQLAAGEPMVHQPIAMTFDDRGRLWIAEAYEYPVRAKEGEGKDKIIILEDTDQDGVFDDRKVFADDLNLVSGLEVGFGGVWVGAAPYLLFIPDRDGDDRPDDEPQVLLDGFDYRDTHETLNAFNWGPDGWLYGCHGVFNYSNVGRPGCEPSDRTPLTCGVWRYHPTRHQFEAFARGTSNPWGVDFNDYGHAFITACVIPHMYHMIQGGRYQRQGGQHVNRHTYDDIKTIADHAHYTGSVRDHAWWGRNQNVENQSTYEAGGGHAHCGAMIYLGNNWPQQYRNSIFMTNLLGNRINQEFLRRHGSGYVASHGDDFLFANDQWFRCINQRLAPDGSVYLIDWYDKQACHRGDKELWDRTNGRVYRVAFGTPDTQSVNLSRFDDAELARLQLHENEWHVRTARRLLAQRAVANKLDEQAVRDILQPLLHSEAPVPTRLRAAWTLHTCGLLTEADRAKMLQAQGHRSEYVRSWAIQLDAEDGTADSPQTWAELAAQDRSPLVRLYLASALQRIPLQNRWAIAEALVRHAQDAGDHNLPLMIWYGLEPLVTLNVDRALELSKRTRIPIVRQFIYRRAASDSSTIGPLLASLGETNDQALQKQVIGEVTQALASQGQLKMPPQWPAVFAKLAKTTDAQLRDQLLAISVKFGDASMFPSLRDIVRDADNEPGSRKSALAALVTGKDKQLVPLLVELLDDDAMRSPALQAMSRYNDASIPSAILRQFTKLDGKDRSAAIATLASRSAFAKRLMDAVKGGLVERDQISAFTIRQLMLFEDAELNQKIEECWGQVAKSSGDKERRIASFKERFDSATLATANLPEGRALYVKTCAKCHRLFGEGGAIGPDITGSNRADLDYLLHNVIDPNALIGKDYQTTQIVTADGRVLLGLLKNETETALTLQTADEAVVIEKDEIDARKLSKTSMMPEGQLDTMRPDQVRDLLAYLASPMQVPLPGEGPIYDDSTRRVHGAIEGESLQVTRKTRGTTAPQGMQSFKAGKWSGDRHLWWTQGKPGDALTLTFAAPSAGDYEVSIAMTKAIDYGIFQLSLNGVSITDRVDLFDSQVVSTGPMDFGTHQLGDENTLTIKIVGANEKALKRYMFGLDYIYLRAAEKSESR